MSTKIVRLCYRKIINAASQAVWDKYVFDSTYQEFKMQSQLYNQAQLYSSFAELLQYAKGADNLHFLVSAAATGYLQQLGDKIPDITDNLGKHFLLFKNYQFEIIDSDIKNKSLHQVAISFFSEPMIWHDTAGNYLLLGETATSPNSDGMLTHMVALQPFLSIYSLKTATS